MEADERAGERGRAATLAPPARQGGERTPAQTTPAVTVARGRPRAMRLAIWLIILVGLVVAIVFGVNYARDQALYVSTSNAQVTGDLIQVGTVNTGRISSVDVDIGATIRQGEILASVTVPSTLSVTDSGVPLLGFRGTVDAEAPVVSPIDGVVAQRIGNPGDTVAAGQTIIIVVNPAALWVQAQVDENKIGRVRVGQAVDVYADTLRRTLPGRVLAVGDASAASFSPLPQGNTSGNYTKVTQLVPLKIGVDYGNDRLVLGSSVEVKIHVQ